MILQSLKYKSDREVLGTANLFDPHCWKKRKNKKNNLMHLYEKYCTFASRNVECFYMLI
jgi:hypothetical protein